MFAQRCNLVAFSVWIITILILSHVDCILYPYETSARTCIEPSDDGSSEQINIDIGFPFFDTIETTMFVSTVYSYMLFSIML